MTAQVHIQLAGVEQALSGPAGGAGRSIADNRYHVSVLKQGKEEKREVAIGLRNNIDVQILSGLEAGDEVTSAAAAWRPADGGAVAAERHPPQLPFRRADGGGAEGSA